MRYSPTIDGSVQPLLFFLILLALFLCASCATTGELTERPPVDNSDSQAAELSSADGAVLTVHGLSCPLCANNLDGQLAKIEGVESAHIDLNTGSTVIRFSGNHRVTRLQLQAAVKNAGFTLKEIQVKERVQ